MRLTTWNLRNGAGRDVWPQLAAHLVFLQEASELPQGDSVVWQRVPGERWGSAVISTVGSIRPIVLPGYEGWGVGGEVGTLAVFSLHAPSPRGPSMLIRPTPEQCHRWAEKAGFDFVREEPGIAKWHWGLLMQRP